MVVTHDLRSLDGQPRLDGRDVTVAIIVRGVANEGVNEFCGSYDLSREEVEEALKYCMNECCVRTFAAYCNGCTKNPRYFGRKSGMKFWEIARCVYNGE